MEPKIALITGASRGLGRNAATHLARAGRDLILTYRSGRAQAQSVQAELQEHGVRVAVLPLDVADSASFPAFADAVRKTLTEWGRERFDFLVNNAGVGFARRSRRRRRLSSTRW